MMPGGHASRPRAMAKKPRPCRGSVARRFLLSLCARFCGSVGVLRAPQHRARGVKDDRMSPSQLGVVVVVPTANDGGSGDVALGSALLQHITVVVQFGSVWWASLCSALEKSEKVGRSARGAAQLSDVQLSWTGKPYSARGAASHHTATTATFFF